MSLLARALSKEKHSASKELHSEKLQLLLAVLSPIQKRFILDPARFKVARCTRRAGKTFVDAAYMIYECLRNSNTPVLYAGLTRDSAKEAVWDILISLLESLHIPHQARASALMVEFPNGSKITVFGCDANNARNRLRGRKFRLVIFDETGFFAALDPLVYAVLPMLADFGGTLCLTSSPGELLQGLFYDADQGTNNDDWSRYFWSIHDNPFFQKPALDNKYKTRADEELSIVLTKQFKGNANHPGYRREWLGEWVADNTSLVYPITNKNKIDIEYKMRDQMHAIGIELGCSFANSCVIGRFSQYAREFQIIDQWTKPDLEMDDFFKYLDLEIEKYDPAAIVGHIGKYSKNMVEELRRRYKIPLIAMDDQDKSFHQRVFANDIQRGYIQVKASLPICLEFGKIVKGHDGEELVGQENYAANAALVMYRKVHQTTLHSYVPPLSEEERHIQQLEQSRFEEEPLWYDR